jgi:hypothetical protein
MRQILFTADEGGWTREAGVNGMDGKWGIEAGVSFSLNKSLQLGI